MKGLSLPINILIIIAIAVIVLIALIAMFYPAFFSGSTTISLEAAKSQACRALTANNCNVGVDEIGIANFDANKDGNTYNTADAAQSNGDTLDALCDQYLQTSNDDDCKALCGC